jgi:hypothetical protein
MNRRQPSKRSRIGLRLLGLVLIGVVGAISITRVFVGSYPWEPVPYLEIRAWRTFDGLFTVAFGFLVTIGVALVIANVVGGGITCPRCGTVEPQGGEDLRDVPVATSMEQPRLRERQSSRGNWARQEPAPHGEPAA